MTEEIHTGQAGDAAPVLPHGAYEAMLVLCALAFVTVAGGLFAYGQYGAIFASGLDEACAEASYLSGQRMEGLGNHEEAIRRYRQALDGRFSDPERKFTCGRAIGDLYVRENRYAEALEAYRALPPEAFKTAGAYTGYVTALWRENQFKEAEQLGLKWLALASEEKNLEQQLWANGALMSICEQTDRIDEAIVYGQRAVEMNPASEIQLQLARLFHRLEQPEAARKHLQSLLEHTQDTRLLEAAKRQLAAIS